MGSSRSSAAIRVSAVGITLLACLALAPAASAAPPTCSDVDLGSIPRGGSASADPSCTGTGPLTFAIASQPAHGTASMLFGSFVYEHDGSQGGSDSFTYRAVNALGEPSAPARVTVTASNEGPQCGSDVLRLRRDKPASASAPCFDPEGDELTLTVTDAPQHGTLTFAGAEFTYDPDDGFRGVDSVVARASDGIASSPEFRLDIVVTRNHPPTCTLGTVHTTVNTATSVSFASACSDTDFQDAPVVSLDPGLPPEHGAVTGLATYTPDAGFTGADRFGIVATDGDAQTRVTQRVHVANGPFCSPAPPTRVRPGAVHDFLADCTAPGAFDVVVVGGPAHGTLTQSGSSFTYRAGSVAAADSFSFKAVGASESAPAVQQITIDPTVNAPPECADLLAAQVVYAGHPRTLHPSCSDADGDQLTFEPVGDPDHGTLTVDGGVLRYTADAGFAGLDMLAYRVSDDRGASVGPFDYVVESRPPESPQCFPIGVLTVRPGRSVTFAVDCRSPQGDAQSYEVTDQPDKGTLVQGPGAQMTYAANANSEGDDYFDVRAVNAVGASAPVRIGVSISDTANSRPVCVAATMPLRVGPGTTTQLPLNARCTDADGDALTFSLKARAGLGSVTPTGPAATLAYVAGPDVGSDQFTYVATDVRGATSDETAFDLEVVVPARPTCETQPPLVVPDGGSGTVTLECTDPNHDALTYEIVTPPTQGTLAPAGDSTTASRSYTPAAGTTADRFEYRVRSASGASDSYTQEISVTPKPNAAPTCASGAEEVVAGGTLVLPVAPCSDPDGDPLTILVVTLPQHGSLTIDELGRRVYTPEAGCSSHDEFTFKAADGSLESEVASVDVTITPADGPRGVVVDAPSGAPLEGATVHLQRREDGEWRDVGTADPCVPAGEQPQRTEADGRFGWSAFAGVFRVRVNAPGHRSRTSDEQTVPPAGPELDVPMERNAAPVAAIDNVATAFRGETVTFTSASTDDARVVEQRWDLDGIGDFDDGTGTTASRSFDALGVKSVRLQVVDDEGEQDVATATVEVLNRAPTVDLSGPATGRRGEALTFSATAADADPDAAPPALSWDLNDDGEFGDETGPRVTASFDTSGDHRVRVRATDADGGVDEAEAVVTITANRPPTVAITSGPAEGGRREALRFEATATDPDSQTAPTLSWDLDGDGDFDDASGTSATATFSELGEHTVRVRATDSDNATAVAAKVVTIVNRPPTVAVKLAGERHGYLTFTATAYDADTGTTPALAWELDGDNRFDDGVGPTARARFRKRGVYTIQVRATDGDGARTVATLEVTVGKPKPERDDEDDDDDDEDDDDDDEDEDN